MNLKRVGGAIITAAAAITGLFVLSPAAPATALSAGTAAAGSVTLSPTTGNSSTTIGLSFSATQNCPGDFNSGYLWQTFIAPRSLDPATFTYYTGLPKASDGTDNGSKALRTSGAWIRNNTPGLTDGQIAPPSGVVFSNATYSGLSGEYWIGIACTQDDVSYITQTVKYWVVPVTITPASGQGANNFTYATGFTPNKPTIGTLTPGEGQVQVAFTPATAVTGNPADSGYKVIVQDSSCTGAPVQTVSGGSSPITVTGLANGTTYCFSVKATNTFGDSAASTTSTAAAVAPLGATPANKSVVLSWSASPWSALAPLTDYVIEYRRYGVGTWRSAKTKAITATTFTVTGLTNGLDYEFRVAGKNAGSTGSYQTVGPVIPRAVPGKPRSVKATPRNGRIDLTWLAPASNGGNAITDYAIELWNGSAWTPVVDGVGTGLSHTITGLVNGTGYKVRIAAVNDAGTGTAQATAKAVKPYLTAPTAPKSVKATPRNTAVVVTWAAPANDGGENVTDYLVEWTVDGVTWSSANAGSALTYTINSLVNGTGYKVRVSATNTVFSGYGKTAGTAKAVKPYLSLPTAPKSVKATPRNTAVVVTWAAPANDGGSAITDYLVEWTVDGVTWSSANAGSALTYTINSLVNGTGYKVRVSATNTVFSGYGKTAGTAKAVKPYLSLPTAPKSVKATAASTSLVVSWKAPSNDGGSAITDYRVEWSTNGLTWSSANAGTGLTYTITSLVAGTGYKVRVSATNTVFAGYGTAAGAPKAVKPLV